MLARAPASHILSYVSGPPAGLQGARSVLSVEQLLAEASSQRVLRIALSPRADAAQIVRSALEIDAALRGAQIRASVVLYSVSAGDASHAASMSIRAREALAGSYASTTYWTMDFWQGFVMSSVLLIILTIGISFNYSIQIPTRFESLKSGKRGALSVEQ